MAGRAMKVLEAFGGEDRVLTLYLPLGGDVKQRIAHLKTRSKKLAEEVGDWASRPLEGLLEDLHLGEGRSPLGVGLFASPSGRSLALPLPSPVDGQVISKRPWILPALEALCPLREAWVVWIHRGRGEIFRHHAVLERVEELSEEIPRKVRDAGFRGGEERRLERRAETSLSKFLKDLAWRLRELNAERPAGEVWVTGSEEVMPEALEALGRFSLPVRSLKAPKSQEDLERSVREAMGARFFQEAEDLVERILESPGRSVLGLRQAIDQVNRRALMSLVVEERRTVRGVRCTSCGALGLEEDQCPLCGSGMEEETDLLDAMAHRALLSGAEVLVLGRPSSLREHEGVGGLTRLSR